MLPKVSILIPCYNAERWVEQAIQSALNQTYSNKEVIVVDDGSTDRSLEIIKHFGDRIQWESQLNQGGNAARNRLLELSTGEWIQYLDADDYLQPAKIERQVQYLCSFPQTDIVYSPSLFEYWNDGTIRQEILPIPEPHDPWILLARWYLPQTGSPLWRKQAIVDVGGWKLSQPCCQEHELYSRLLMAGKRFAYFAGTGAETASETGAEASAVYRQWSEATVCKQNKPEVFRQRLHIETTIEQFLQHSGQMTGDRLAAINQARFECARLIWLFDRSWAGKIVAQIRSSDSQFVPFGSAAPAFYRLTYRWFGFVRAEQIAALKRSAFRLLHRPFAVVVPVLARSHVMQS